MDTRIVAQIGWDTHRKFSNMTARDANHKILFRRRIDHFDRTAMRMILRSWPTGTPVVLESTFGWSWVSNELEATGLQPRLASSNKLAAWRKARGLAKSNRVDADLLSELPSEKEPWWEVWLPPVMVREQRELLRHRMGWVRLQTMTKNRIHATLHYHGVLQDHSDLFGRQGRRFLQLLIGEPAGPLPASAQLTVRANLQMLDFLRRQIVEVTREFRQHVERDPAASRLTTLPGVSCVLAYTLWSEIGRIERFRTSKHLASYSLLAPRADDSGNDDGSNPKGRHVGRIGRRTLKWAFIEAAHIAVRCDTHMRAIFDRRTDGGRRDRNRGYIAVARHLATSAYIMWKKEINYDPTPPPRPGARRRRRRADGQATSSSSHPGTGQPDRPMVAASV